MIKYFTLSVMALLGIYQSAYAQFVFNENMQRFEPKPVELPYIGFDFIRNLYPDIVVQVPGQSGAWKNLYRVKTYKEHKRYTDIGWYLFDSVQQKWVESVADRYANSFQGLQQLDSSVWVRYFNNMQFKHKKRCRIFYKNGKMDSLRYENAGSQFGQDYSLEEAHKFFYDAQGRLIQSKLRLSNGLDFTKSISYNSQGQVTSSLSLFVVPGNSTPDSSTWLRYEYNAQGKLSAFSQDLFFGEWFHNQKIEYEYDASGRLSLSKAWYRDGPQLVFALRMENNYTYNSSGKPETYRQWWVKPEGDTTDSKTIFNYNGTQLKYADEYNWKNNAYDTIPLARYLYHESLPLSAKRLPEAETLHLYPNPAQNYLHVEIREAGVFNLYDLQGRLLRQYNSQPAQQEIYIGDLEKGIYLLQLNGQAVHRFIKN